MQGRDWNWWTQRPEWDLALERLCDVARNLGRMLSEKELTCDHKDEYVKCIFHYGQTEKILDAIAWKVFGCVYGRLSPDKLPGPDTEERQRIIAKLKET